MRGLVLATRFLLEVVLVAALAAWGWSAGGGGGVGALFAVVVAVAAAGAWGTWVGPKSRRRLPDPSRLVVELVLFVCGGLAAWVVWGPGAGLAIALGSAVVAVATRAVGEPTPGSWK